jgi:predicted RNase H-like HicB family nuclease
MIMSTAELPKKTAYDVRSLKPAWDEPTSTYECRVLLCPENEGGFSAHALNIAGVVSEGDTIEQALERIADAFKGTVEYHLESNRAIPWRDGDPEFFDAMTGTIERWITVDV